VGIPGGMEQFDDQAFHCDVVGARRALVGNEACLASTVTIDDGDSYAFLDHSPVGRLKQLPRHEDRPERPALDGPAAGDGVSDQPGDAAGIAEDVDRVEPSNLIEKAGHHPGRHAEGVEQTVVGQSVPNRLDVVHRGEFNRRAPQIQFAFSDIDAEPSPRSRAGRLVCGLALAVDLEGQRHAGGAAGRAVVQPATDGWVYHGVAVLRDVGLGQRRQSRELIKRDTGGIDAGLVDSTSIEGTSVVGTRQ